ncbi:hypothetical protein L208DRAFT_1470061 [Tricholoma matsutake]|nr:hypothetical protein L208DRAFT_1470061 [Tricholoma matsutake 945]
MLLTPPIVIEGEPQYKVKSILDSRLHQGKLQYLVHWRVMGMRRTYGSRSPM